MKKIVFLVALGLATLVNAQKNSKVLLTIDGEKISVEDFKRVYEKNLDIVDDEQEKDVEKNLELFINYKLKVKEAYNLKLDTLPSYVNELEKYKNQLSAPYMQDSAFINNLVKDAYYRTKYEVKAKHILVRMPNNASPKDTLNAYQKITKIRDRIVKGEDFEKVAEAESEDPSARDDEKNGRKGNKGNLGFFSAFKMVYPFENAAYTTKVGNVSKPFKTRFGYHILKVDSLRVSKGEVEVAHILINNKNTKGEQIIKEVYNELEKDVQFKALARKYSDDSGTKSKGGKLRKFGAGTMVKPFEDAAFALQNEGEYSKPFKTRFGWHIVQLIQKHPVPPFKELKTELKNRVMSSSIAKLSEKAVIDKLKKKYNIIENKAATAIFEDAKLKNNSKDSLQATILTINKQTYSQQDFANFIQNKKEPIFKLYEDFKDAKILAYYKENLEKIAPEYAHTLQEYRDGLLLFELMQQKIWNKATKDSLGLKNYFIKNSTDYKTKDFDKIKGEVMNDYQNYIEKNWIADLRKNSLVSINTKQLKKLIKHYKK